MIFAFFQIICGVGVIFNRKFEATLLLIFTIALDFILRNPFVFPEKA
jgi:hypothetical protein